MPSLRPPSLRSSSRRRPSPTASARRRGPALNLLARRAGLTIGLLRPADLPAAQRLIYQVYFEELGWEPQRPNPSNLRADHAARRFRDAFDDTAIWVGLFAADDRLIGVTRVIDPALSAGLEVTRYTDAIEVAARVGEANRVALLPEWRRGPALMLLWLGGAWAARRQGLTSVLGTTTTRVFERHARHAGWRVSGAAFRYHPTDAEAVLPLSFNPGLGAVSLTAARMLVGRLRVWRRRDPSRPQSSNG